ncbi:MAG: hypothetical protein J5794_04660, partial [Lachnospiraceae bacterium]|nr:hypothetical protein [Lachnospiraceae bacterium]
MKLTNQNWIPGSYDRRTLAGNLLQKKFRTAEISIVRAAAFCLAEDFLAEGLLKAGRISGPAYQAYLSALTDYFRTAEELTEGTDETVLAAVQRLRTEFFGETLFHARFREADLIAPERKETGIWQEAHLEAEWKKEAFVFFFSEAGESGSFLQVLQKALAARKRCFLLSFDDLQGRLPGAEDLKVLLNRAGIPDGAELLTVPAVSGAPDISAVTLPEDDAVLFGFGEEALLLTRNLTVPALLYVTPRSLTAKAVTNLFTKALPSLVYVPAGFDILPDVPLILPTKCSYYHLAELEKIHGEQVYSLSAEELERLAPGAFFSVYDDHFPLSIDPGFEWREGSFLSALEACKLRKLNEFPGIRAYHGCFREETFEEVPIHWETGKKEAQVVVDGVRLSSQIPLKVLTDFPEPVSPRQYFFDQPGNEVCLISNFAFFYTHRLEAMYNFRRQDTPEECLHRRVGYLDHYRFTDPDGTRHETFPLYRKSCFARTRSGEYRTFSWSLCGGEIECAPDTVLSWSPENVNPPAGAEQEIAVYTPLISVPMEGQDPLHFLLPAGEERLNLIVIGEYVNAAREG